jgi:hypothetical protein
MLCLCISSRRAIASRIAPALRAFVVVSALAVVAGAVTMRWWLAWAVEATFERSMVRSDRWHGSVGDVRFDPATGRLFFSDLQFQAGWESLALRSIDIPSGWLALDWRRASAGHFPFVAVAIAPTVSARSRQREAREPSGRGAHARTFALDIAIVGGTWEWSHDAFVHRVEGVNGSLVGLGTATGAARLDVVGVAGGVPVRGSGPMDFWRTHGEAIDLTFETVGAGRRALQGVPEALVGVALDEGRFDGVVRFTMDRGSPDLDANPCMEPEAIRVGCLEGFVRARGLRVRGVLKHPIAVRDATITVTGGVGSGRTVRLSAVSDAAHIEVTRSEWTGRSGSAADVVASFEPIVFDALLFRETQITLIDDSRQPPIRFHASGARVTGAGLGPSSDGPGRIAASRAEVAGGTLDASGTIDLRSWPPPTDLVGAVRGVQLARLDDPVGRFVDAHIERGTGDLDATLVVDASGALDSTLHVDLQDVRGRIGDWSARVGELTGDVFEGGAVARDVALSAAREGTSMLHSARLPVVRASWDGDRLLDTSELVGRVELDDAEVVFTRTAGSTDSIDRPDASFTLDVAIRDAEVLVRDPLVEPAVDIRLSDVALDVESFSSLRRDARWTIDAQLVRGGHVSGWAVADPFRVDTPADRVRGRLAARGLDLEAWSDLGAVYLGLPPVAGQADLELVIERAGGHLEGHVRSIDLHTAALRTRGERADLTLAWSHAPPRRTLSGSIDDVTVRVRPSVGSPGDMALPRMPTLAIPDLEVRDAELVVETDALPIVIEDGSVHVRNVLLGDPGETGRIDVRGTLWDGQVDGYVGLGRTEHRVAVEIGSADLVRANSLLAEGLGVDVADGRFSLLACARIDPARGLYGDAWLRIEGADVLQSEDWSDPVSGLKNAGVGAVVDVLERDDTLDLRSPVTGRPEAPQLDWGWTVLDALLRRGDARLDPQGFDACPSMSERFSSGASR